MNTPQLPVTTSAEGVNWSISKLFMYEQCPMRFRLKYIERMPEPPQPADSPLERGNRIHKHLERYVKGEENSLAGIEAKGIGSLDPAITQLRELYGAGMATSEEDWWFDQDWNECARSSVWLWSKLDFSVRDESQGLVITGDYKGFPLDTVIPIQGGFTDMASIAVGETVFDIEGKPCTVVGKSKVKNIACYKIFFDDGNSVICDADHQWVLTDGRVVNVQNLKKNDLVPTAGALQLPVVNLPIDPYVFGLWLADGKHTSAEITKPDAFIWEEVKRRGYEIGVDTGTNCECHTVLNIRKQLTDLGVLGHKHIPHQYMWSSYEQRVDLLRGFCDGDGYANRVRNQVSINIVDPQLSDDLLQLLRSLGQRPVQFTTVAVGFGKKRVAYPLAFRPRIFNPFLIPRKANVAATFGEGYSWRRRVTDVVEVENIPTQCISVDSPSHTFLVTENLIPTHNSGKSKYKAVDHIQQTQLYVAVSALKYEWADRHVAEVWYVDEGWIRSQSYTREEALRFVGRFQSRVDRIYRDKFFKPNPSVITCKWCPFSPRGTGSCPVGV